MSGFQEVWAVLKMPMLPAVRFWSSIFWVEKIGNSEIFALCESQRSWRWSIYALVVAERSFRAALKSKLNCAL